MLTALYSCFVYGLKKPWARLFLRKELNFVSSSRDESELV